MSQIKVKFFSVTFNSIHDGLNTIELAIEEWVEANDEIEIVDVKTSSSNTHVIITTITYRIISKRKLIIENKIK